jgi:hypothetical protein
MPSNRLTKEDRERLSAIEVGRWERERRQRVEALCAAITAQRQALAKTGNAYIQHRAPGFTASTHMASALNALHDALAAAINEQNPFMREEVTDVQS